LPPPVAEPGGLTCLNVQFGPFSSVGSFHGDIITARALPKLERRWNRTRCDWICDSRRAYFRLFVRLTLERHDFDKRSVGGMTEKPKLKVTVSILDRFHVRHAVIRQSSAKGSPERLVLAYPNEETLRGLIADTSIVGLGFSSRDEAAFATGAAGTKGATPCQADRVAGSHAEERLVHRLREQLAFRMKFSQIRRLATAIVQLSIAAAMFIFYSKNIVPAAVRAVLAGSV
jgi:hypothetical protein